MRRLLPVFLLCVLAACQGDPVKWGEAQIGGGPTPPRENVAQSVPDSSGCAASLRVASSGKFTYAVWWKVRSDSSAALMVARSTDGEAWGKPVVADSTDHSRRGCARPAPAIAADSASQYVHLAYFLEPSAGSGVFFAHSMDSAATFHSPVPIVFGTNPSRVSVSSHGDKVAVAYEDPNASEPIIGVAFSRTMGHLFEARMQATSSDGRARQPVIRVSKDSVYLWWSEYSANHDVTATRPAYQTGEWR
jgi:hypothetical protein